MKKIAIAAVSLAALSSTVFAADTAVTHDWTGLYVGAVGGGAAMSTEISDYWCYAACDAPDTTDFGAIVGGTLGFNYQTGSLVAGLEGDLTNGVSGSVEVSDPNDGDVGFWDNDINWIASIRARAGLAVGDTMAYVTGGIAMADAKYEGGWDYTSPSSNDYKATWEGTQFGLTGGMGIEHAFSDNISMKAEYLVTVFDKVDACFGSADNNYACDDPQSNPDSSVHWAPSVQSVRVGLNYSF